MGQQGPSPYPGGALQVCMFLGSWQSWVGSGGEAPSAPTVVFAVTSSEEWEDSGLFPRPQQTPVPGKAPKGV